MRADTADHLFLGDQRRTLQRRNQPRAVQLQGNLVIGNDDAVIIDIQPVNQPGEEDSVVKMEHDVPQGLGHPHRLALVVLQHPVQFIHRLGGQNERVIQL